MISVTILGSTGSIGTQTLEVCKFFNIKVHGLACYTDIVKLTSQIEGFAPAVVSVKDATTALALQELLISKNIQPKPEITHGEAGLANVTLAGDENTIVVAAMMGFAGLLPVLTALRNKRRVALANKETLVAGGTLVMQEVKRLGLDYLRPVDSEHSAIWQCLQAGRRQDLQTIYLTASGGPFRNYSAQQLADVTLEQAFAHPTWKMGQKITIDSATMMNKGLEMIEACWLFGVSPTEINIVVHPQSIVHSMVQFVDGSTIAQLGFPDMRVPIQTALLWPRRQANATLAGYDPFAASACQLDFVKPDEARFPCLRLAREAWWTGGTMPTALNAANEEAVRAFIEGRCAFLAIANIVEKAMEWHMRHAFSQEFSIDDIIEIDSQVRRYVAANLV